MHSHTSLFVPWTWDYIKSIAQNEELNRVFGKFIDSIISSEIDDEMWNCTRNTDTPPSLAKEMDEFDEEEFNTITQSYAIQLQNHWYTYIYICIYMTYNIHTYVTWYKLPIRLHAIFSKSLAIYK
jgi:hypothetical protein